MLIDGRRLAMKKTYAGSCHCGAVRFEAAIDLAAETSRCNCSICRKMRFWKAIVMPDDFRLLQGAEALSDYQFGAHRIHHRFCRQCGVKPFGQAHVEGRGDFYAVNLACLDDAPEEELAKAPVVYQDGRHDQWGAPPAETRYL
jgi:hypothetical protein